MSLPCRVKLSPDRMSKAGSCEWTFCMQGRFMVASHIENCPGDLQAGRQGKEGLVSVFLVHFFVSFIR